MQQPLCEYTATSESSLPSTTAARAGGFCTAYTQQAPDGISVCLLPALHPTQLPDAHLQHALVVACHKVDGHALAAEAAAASNAVQVVLWLSGQVVVDHQGHLQQRDTCTSAKLLLSRKEQENAVKNAQSPTSVTKNIKKHCVHRTTNQPTNPGYCEL